MESRKKKIPKKEQYIIAIAYTQGEEYLKGDTFKEEDLNPEMCASCFSKAVNVLSIDLKTRGGRTAFHCNVPICETHLKDIKRMKGFIGS